MRERVQRFSKNINHFLMRDRSTRSRNAVVDSVEEFRDAWLEIIEVGCKRF